MNEKDTELSETERTKRLAEELREHPRLREQVEAILKLVRSDNVPIRKADDVEKLLIPEIRKLGQNAMQEWALARKSHTRES